MKVSKISVKSSGLIYRNPVPHVCSRHGYFPSIAKMDNGEILASFAIGEAFEAANLHTWIARSNDQGETWSEPVELFPFDPAEGYSDCVRITAFSGGEVVAFLVRHERHSHPGVGLASDATMGFVPTELSILRSADYGHSWGAPERMAPAVEGPEFELCCPVVPLRDGRWVIPTSTWRRWDGYAPGGMRMVGLVSSDRGHTWPEAMEVMAAVEEKIIHWESKIIELADGRLLAAAWAFDEANAKDLPNRYSLSGDGGKTWSAPASTGLQGQTMSILELSEGRILSVYRRMDKPGLWANISHLEGQNWVNDEAEPLWGVSDIGRSEKNANMVHEFNELKFGAPTVTRLDDGTIFVAFWCYEKNVSNIRWTKLMVD